MTLTESGPEGRIDLDDDYAAFSFNATAVRRTPSGERPITWASLSREVVDLVAEVEAGVGVKVDVAFVTEAALAMLIWRVHGPMELAVGLLAEVRALLKPFYRLSETSSSPAELPAVSVLAVRPSATLPGSGSAGFNVIPGPGGATSCPKELIPGRTIWLRRCWPNRACATGSVRSWFDGVDISPEASEFEVTTASLAASLIRLPTFDDQSWHAFAAETSRSVPVTISGFSPVEAQAIRVGTRLWPSAGQDARKSSQEQRGTAPACLRRAESQMCPWQRRVAPGVTWRTQ